MSNLLRHGAGPGVHAAELVQFLKQAFADNERMETQGLPKTPVCIWGKHGIGKTEIVRTFAQEKGYHLACLAPAQIEEMGDLLGMPSIMEGCTVFNPPRWAPSQPGPGILLLDDINRADDRILRGLMPLLQDGALLSWALPPRWHIVLTANPDTGHYSVTTLDDAMMTRMAHVTLEFDLQTWVKWATAAQIDTRGIHFVLAHPETITGKRTTARTLTRFFRLLGGIPDLRAEINMTRLWAEALLDAETAQAFVQFIHAGGDRLPAPDIVLSASNFDEAVAMPLYTIVKGPPLRTDILSVVCTRLAVHVGQLNKLPDASQRNLKLFLLMEYLPPALRFALARDLAASSLAGVQAVLSDPEVAARVV